MATDYKPALADTRSVEGGATARPSAQKSIFRATALLSSTSFLGIAVGLISSKCLAVLIGPSGFGFMGLAQSLLALATTVAGMGVSVAIVRAGAKAAAEQDHHAFTVIRKAANFLVSVTTAIALVALVVFRTPLSRWMLGTPDYSPYVVLIGVALAFNVAAGIQVSLVNAHHRVSSLVKISMLTTMISTTMTVLVVWRFGKAGIIPAIIFGAGASWLVAQYFAHREIGSAAVSVERHEVLAAGRSLLQFGGSYTASLLLGTGVQMIMPTLVLHTLGTDSVGFYRAAISVSVNYLGFLLVAMAQDYYPRISAAVDNPSLLVELINRQQRLIMVITLPIVLGALAAAPYLVPLIFSAQFTPTVMVLEWHLIGDLFKFTSWTMAYVIMARCKSWMFLITESIAGFTMLLCSWFGMRWFGLAGLGIAFLTTYIVYTLTVWIVVRQSIPLKFTAENKRVMVLGLAAAVLIRVLPATPLAPFRTPVALILAAIAAIVGLNVVRKEFQGEECSSWSLVRTYLIRSRLSN